MADGAVTAGKTGRAEELDDRQRHPRTAVFCPAKLASAGQAWDCEILDISAGGAKIRLETPLDPAVALSLTIGSHGTLPVQLMWQNGQYLGVAFLCDLETSTQLVRDVVENPGTNREQRDRPRTAVLWTGRLHAGAQGADCRVLNISATGAKIHLLEPLPPVPMVSLRIERFGEFPGDVIWREKDLLGIRFRDDPEDIIQIFGAAVPALRRERR
jgi:hypothetical protein